METLTLNKPYSFEGADYTEIVLDLDGLTGEDMLQAEREFSAGKEFAPVPVMNSAYIAIVAAKAAKKPAEFIKRLPAKEFSKVIVTVQNFLLG